MGSSERNRGFVPLPEVQKHTDRIRFDLGLPPWVPQEDIGVHVRRIHTLMQIGGINELRVVGVTTTEHDETLPMIVGVDAQGSAVAGKVGVGAKTRISEVKMMPTDQNPGLYSGKWIGICASLDLNRLKQTMQPRGGQPTTLRSSETWSHHLHTLLQQTIRQEGTKHLILNVDSHEKILWCIISTMCIPIIGSGWPFLIVLGSFLLSSIITRVLELRRFPGKNTFSDQEYRFSFYAIGPQIDRALLLNILAQLPNRPLVKTLAPQKE